MKNGEAEVTVHIREDKSPNISSKLPHWVRKNVTSNGKVVNTIFFKHLCDDEILVNIDHYVRTKGNYAYGCMAIKELSQKTQRSEELYSEYLNEIKEFKKLFEVIGTPETSQDYILLMATAKSEGNREAMMNLLADQNLIELCKTDSYLREKYEEMQNQME